MPSNNDKSLNATTTFTGASSGYSSGSANQSSTSPYTNLNSYESLSANTSANPSGYSSYVTGGGGGATSSGSTTGGATGIAGTNSYDTYAAVDHNSSSAIYVNSSSTHSHGFDLAKTDKLSSPLVHDDALAQEVLAKAGPAYTYQRKDYSHDIGSLHADGGSSGAGGNSVTNSYQDYDHNNSHDYKTSYGNSTYGSSEHIKLDSSSAPLFSASSVINQDPDPIRIVKPNTQNIVYKQQVNIRYLQPPTPPPPAPIIIREKQIAPPPSQPPIIIRQTAPAPPTPPPLTIREKAPTPPPVLEPTIIERPVPPPPAPPRQVIIERVPAPPAKPRPIIYEKWLPYKSIKRPVIVQKVKQTQPQAAPKNVIIEYEKPKAVAIRQVIEEGIFRVDPATYQTTESTGEIRFVDRITDLPIENSRILSQLNLESSTNTNDANLSTIYAQYLNAPSNTSTSTNHNHNNNNSSQSSSSSHHQSHLNSAVSVPSLIDSKYYSSSSNQYSYTSQNNVEYETITTSVPETLAAKIIAEAQAAGAITRLANC